MNTAVIGTMPNNITMSAIRPRNRTMVTKPAEYEQGVWNFDQSSVSDSDSSNSENNAAATAGASFHLPPGVTPDGIALAIQRKLSNGRLGNMPQHLAATNDAATAAVINQRLQAQGASNVMMAMQARRRSQLELAALAAASQSPHLATNVLKRNISGMSGSAPEQSSPQSKKYVTAGPVKGLNGASAALAILQQQYQSQQQQAAAQQQFQQQQAMLMAAHQQQQEQTLRAASNQAGMLRGAVSQGNIAQYRQLAASTGKDGYPRVESDSSFLQAARMQAKPKKKRINRSVSEYFAPSQVEVKKPDAEEKKPVKPEEHLRELLKKQDLDLNHFFVEKETFLPNTKEMTEDYPETAQAARDENLKELEKLHGEGKNLQSANVYGESIIHIVCRRANLPCYEFLTQTGKVSIRVKDDIGRTPLHDAAWTDKPNFGLVEKIIRQEPDLLFARDNRKASPLAYVPPSRWTRWCKFLDENPSLIKLALDCDKTKRVDS